MDRKEDLKHIKEEAKNLFGKVKGVFASNKKQQDAVHDEAHPPKVEEEEKVGDAPQKPAKVEKKNGFKLFGNKVKLGISKIFSKKEQPENH